MAPKTAAEGAVWLQTAVPCQRPHLCFYPAPHILGSFLLADGSEIYRNVPNSPD